MIASRTLETRQLFRSELETLNMTLGLPTRPVCIWLADETAQVLKIVAAVGLSDEYVRESFLRLDEPSVASRVFSLGQTIVVPDIVSEEAWKYKQEAAAMGLKAAVVVPLQVRKKIVGVLDVYTCESKGFTPSEMVLIEGFAKQIAETQRHLSGLEVLNEVSLIIGSELHPETVFKSIMEAAEKVLECEHVSLFLVERNGDLVLEVSSTAGIARKRFASGEGLAGWVAQTGRPELVPDATKHSHFIPGMSSNVTERSMLLVPITLEGKVSGVISADMDGLNGFDEHDQVLLEALAGQAAVAVRNARLFEREKARAETLQRLHQIGEQLLSAELLAQGPEQALRQVAQSAQSVLDADLVDVYQYYEAENRYGIPPILEGKRYDLTVSKDDIFEDDVVARIVKDGKPRYTADAQADLFLSGPFTVERPNLPDKRFVVREGVLSSAALPLTAAGETVGVMFVNYRNRQDFAPDQREIIELFANQAATTIYNTRLFQQTKDQAQALMTLSQVAQRLVSIQEAPESPRLLLEQIAQNAKAVLDADIVELYEYLPDKKTYQLPQVSVGEQRGPVVPKDKIYKDDAVFQLIHREEPLYTKRMQDEPIFAGPYTVERTGQPTERYAIREELESVAAIPLRAEQETVGLMFVNFRRPQAFTDEQKRLIELFANQAAVAIHNARLYQAAHRRAESMRVLNEIGQTLTSGIRLKQDKILELIYEQAKELTGAQDMYIALYDEGTGEIRFELAIEHDERVYYETRKADMKERGRTEEIIFVKEPILHQTQMAAKAWYKQPEHKEFIGRVQPSYLGVPMVVGKKVLGVIAISDWEREYAYDEQDLQALSSMASQAAIALDNAMLYYEVNQQLERRVQALAALNEVGQTLTSGIRLRQDEILELIHKQAGELMDTDNMYIALYDEPTDTVRFGLMMVEGKPTDMPPRKAGKGRTEYIIRNKEPILISTKAEAESWYDEPGREDYLGREMFGSWLGVPMVAGEKVLGVIAIYHPTRDNVYSSDDLDTLQAMASQAAIALDNATLYYEANRELERLYKEARSEAIAAKQLATLGTAIAALQHRINNTFNIIVPNVTRLRKRVDMTEKTIVEILDIIERNARYTSDIIGRIQEPLREVEVQDVDANAVLSDVVAKARDNWQADSTRPAVEVSLELDDSIPHIQAPIGQISEVLSNLVDNAYRAMKNGGRLTVISQRTDGTIQIRVQDTGCGISLDVQKRLFVKPVPSREPGGGAGLGLWLSRLMLQSIGGDVKIEKTDSSGTTMLVQIPAPGAGKEARS